MALTAVLLILATALAAEVPNASFELAADGDPALPAGWNGSFAEFAQFTWDTIGRTGSRSARVEVSTVPADMPTNVAAWRNNQPAPPPGQYYLQTWVKGQNLAAGASVRLLLRDEQGQTFSNLAFTTRAGTFDWYRFLALVTIPEQTATVQWVLGLSRTTGTVWFDDLAFIKPEELAAGLGSVAFTPEGPFLVNQPLELTMRYTVGSNGLVPGGGIRLNIPNWRKQRFWGRVENPRVECSRGDATFELGRGQRSTSWPPVVTGGLLNATLTAGSPRLLAGDWVTLTWQTTTTNVYTEDAELTCEVDTDGSGAYLPLGQETSFRLVADRAARLQVSATPTPLPGEQARLTIAAFDVHSNPAKSFTGQVLLSVDGPAEVPASVLIEPNDAGAKRLLVRFPQPGIYRITATAEDGLRGVSNPVWVRPDTADRRIFFGDIHVHGEISADAVGDPAETYVFARDYYGLDFAGLADHSPAGERWVRTKQANEANRDLPWFDTIHGYESSFRYGHHNVYYPDDDPPYVGSPNVTQLWADLGGREAVTIPHTSNTDSGNALRPDGTKVWSHMDWEPTDPTYQRVVELVQVRGSFEEDQVDPKLRIRAGGHGASVQDALAMGRELGFIGSTDTHDGLPGSKDALAAILAPRLHRRDLWNGLRDRLCYATSGARILLDFTVNGQRMGSTVAVADPTTPRRIQAEVVGTATIDRIDLIRNGKVLTSSEPADQHARLEAVDAEPLTGRGYYYLRVIQADTHMAWASPVWVEVR